YSDQATRLQVLGGRDELAEVDDVGAQDATADAAIWDHHSVELGDLDVPVRPKCAGVDVGKPRVERGQGFGDGLPGVQLAAVHAAHPVGAAVQLNHLRRAGTLVQA